MSDFSSIVGTLAGYAEGEAAGYVRAMIPSAIRAGLEEGYSSTAILGELRDAGLSIRTQRFYELAGNIAAGVGSETRMAGISLDEVPSAGDVATWATTRPMEGYLYRADLHYVVRDDTGAIVERGVRPFSLRTGELTDWGSVIADMADVIAGGPGEDTPEQTVLGIEPVAIYELVQ